jgi:RHS repeat-associated protein
MTRYRHYFTLAAIVLGSAGCRVDVTIDGAGGVRTLSGSITCDSNGGDCSEQYTRPTREVLVAAPAEGQTLVAWHGCVYRDITSCEMPIIQQAIDRDLQLTIAARFEPVARPLQAAAYSYNGLGQRVTKTMGEVTTVFVYDLDGYLISELDDQSRPLRQHIRLNRVPIAQVTTADDESEAIHYVHTDHLGSPRVLTDQGGNTRWEREETPFGSTVAAYEEITYNLRFPGQYGDRETGLNYNYFRYYRPDLGNYSRPDPIGLPGGLNQYGYALANPVTYHDPYGLYCISEESIASLAGALSGSVAGGVSTFINSGGNPMAALAGAALGTVAGGFSGLFGQTHGGTHLGVGIGAGLAGAATVGTVRGAGGALVGGAISGLGGQALGGAPGSGGPLGAISGFTGGLLAGGHGGAIGGALGGYLGGALADALAAGNDCGEKCL